MEDEKRWALIVDIAMKLGIQVGALIDICEEQQRIIERLEERIEKLEGAAPKADRKAKVSEDELDKFKDIFKQYLGWRDDEL